MTRIRHATIHDLKAVAALGIEALEKNPLPNMVISRDRVLDHATVCITDAGSYCAVVEDDDGQVVGALSALTHEMMFYERRQSSVLQCYCKLKPWGLWLIKDFLRWTRSRRVIKLITFTLDSADPEEQERFAHLLERVGFAPDLPVYVRYRDA